MADSGMILEENRRWKNKCPCYLLTKDKSWVLAEVLPPSSTSLIAKYHVNEPLQQVDIKDTILLDQIIIKEEPDLLYYGKDDNDVSVSTGLQSCSVGWEIGTKAEDMTYDEKFVDVEANSMTGEDIIPTEISEHRRFNTKDAAKRCSVCSKKCKYPSQLRQHMRTHTGEKPFTCTICDETFSQKGNLNCHIRTKHYGKQAKDKKVYIDHANKPLGELDVKRDKIQLDQIVIKEGLALLNYGKEDSEVSALTDLGSCSVEQEKGTIVGYTAGDEEIVGVETNTVPGDDIAMHTEIPGLQGFDTTDKRCSVCGKEFKIPSQMRMHMRIHTGEKPFCCPFCDKRFSVKGSLKSHIGAMHTGKQAYNRKVYPKYSCKYCGKKFESSFLKKHMRIHTGEKPFVCSYCGRGFAEKGSLNKHISLRTGERCPEKGNPKITSKHPCHVCGKQFARPISLATHMRTHTGEKPFTCLCCGKSFALKGGLKSHEVNVHHMHTDGKVYNCQQCDKFFATKSELKKHSTKHSADKPFICLICGNAFKIERSLKGHIHTFHRKEDDVSIKEEGEEYLVLN